MSLLFFTVLVCWRICANVKGAETVGPIDCDVDCVMSEATYFDVQEDAEDFEGTYGYWEA